MSDLRPEGLLFAARIRAELDQIPDVDGWDDLASRLRAAREPGRRRRVSFAPLRQSRRLTVALAACAILALSASGTAMAESGVLSSWLESVGLTHTATMVTPVQASASRAGVTVRATEAYRDSYVVALAVEVDDPGPDPDAVLSTGTGAPSLVTSAGQTLQLVGDESRAGQDVLVFAAPNGGQLTGDGLSLTVPQVTKFLDPLHSKASRTTQGPWLLHLSIAGATSSARHLNAPAPGTVGKVRFTYHDFRLAGGYLSGRVDVAELEPNVVVPTNLVEPIGPAPSTVTALWVYGPGGNLLEPVATIGDRQGKGPVEAATTVPKTYHWGYLFATQGPGMYRLVMQSGGVSMERDLQVP
jgi:hypothetical protein